MTDVERYPLVAVIVVPIEEVISLVHPIGEAWVGGGEGWQDDLVGGARLVLIGVRAKGDSAVSATFVEVEINGVGVNLPFREEISRALMCDCKVEGVILAVILVNSATCPCFNKVGSEVIVVTCQIVVGYSARNNRATASALCPAHKVVAGALQGVLAKCYCRIVNC